jgi:hypothetical protein
MQRHYFSLSLSSLISSLLPYFAFLLLSPLNTPFSLMFFHICWMVSFMPAFYSFCPEFDFSIVGFSLSSFLTRLFSFLCSMLILCFFVSGMFFVLFLFYLSILLYAYLVYLHVPFLLLFCFISFFIP